MPRVLRIGKGLLTESLFFFPLVSLGGDTRYGEQRSYGLSGYNLPPLNAALGGDKSGGRYSLPLVSSRVPGDPTFSPPSGSSATYVRSEGTAPSRTHSPVSHHTAASGSSGSTAVMTGPAFHLPHTVGQTHGHSPFFPGASAPARQLSPRAGSPGHVATPTPTISSTLAGGGGGGPPASQVPSISELERHYRELSEQRRKMAEMLDKTDKYLAGVKRGIEEMHAARKGGSSSGGGVSSPPAQSSSATSVPLQTRSERNREGNVWPILPQDPPSRD